MALSFLSEAKFAGPAFPEPFVQFELENELKRAHLLPKTTGEEGKALEDLWQFYRRKLLEMRSAGGSIRVRNYVIEPLIQVLGYGKVEEAEDVETREGKESGGSLLLTQDNTHKLRIWTVNAGLDLDAPTKRGQAYRYSWTRVAARVLLAKQERIGILTDGIEFRILISDPARPDSQIIVNIDTTWKTKREIPDSFLLLLALASPQGAAVLPTLIEKARLKQTAVTKELRIQARQAIEGFIQEILDHPENEEAMKAFSDKQQLAKNLWHEGLITVYRLLFILKGEASDEYGKGFNFSSAALWRNTFSPTVALSPIVREILDNGIETGTFLEDGLKRLFLFFASGLSSTELHISPLGGALFGSQATPILSQLKWGDRACAMLLDKLLWTPRGRGRESRERVHYGPLDVEDLGRVYEALLELEPGIAVEPMCRLKRSKLEVVVPIAQGERYRSSQRSSDDNEPEEEQEESGEEESGRGTQIEWIEEINKNQFYLRVGLGRKATGSYYTPHSFVRFLVQDTLGPLCEDRSPKNNPNPNEILKLKVLDPAMGSGHFLVEACRFLGDKLYESCRLCDEKVIRLMEKAEKAKSAEEKEKPLKEAQGWLQRVADLPDPDDELVKYLPSRAPEGEESGLSQIKATALCRRLVAVHCLYGVDKNPLAVELAKLSIWLESQAEGMPLTFLDHRFVVGDSLTGPFFHHLLKCPGSQQPIDDLLNQDLSKALQIALQKALLCNKELETSVGTNLSDLELKMAAKHRLDEALLPFKVLAAAWSGGVKLGVEKCDATAYLDLLQAIAQKGGLSELILSQPLRSMIAKGLGLNSVPENCSELIQSTKLLNNIPCIAFDLSFPEVFYPDGFSEMQQGFHSVLGNPPWEQEEVAEVEFWAQIDLRILELNSVAQRKLLIKSLLEMPQFGQLWNDYLEDKTGNAGLWHVIYKHQIGIVDGASTSGKPDGYKLFTERSFSLVKSAGFVAFVLPSSFHANEGATGIRDLLFSQAQIRFCFSFENRKKLFEIDSRVKFALISFQKSEPNKRMEFPCAFYLYDDGWLFSDVLSSSIMFSYELIEQIGGKHKTFIELRRREDVEIFKNCIAHAHETVGNTLREEKICLAQGFSLTRENNLVERIRRPLFSNISKTDFFGEKLCVREGKTFHQFTDVWGNPPELVGRTEDFMQKAHWPASVAYYRLAFRKVASSTNERTVIFCVLLPGAVFVDSVCGETTPSSRSNSKMLAYCSVFNSFVFDWLARQKVAANVMFYLLEDLPLLKLKKVVSFLAHGSLRLVSNHEGYDFLWGEQLGQEWRENKKKSSFPIIENDEDRWKLRAAIDAVVADGYGLTKDQYRYVLSTFSHLSYVAAPELCLACFDELKQGGHNDFIKKYDPYWNIPLNEALPKPVIELPIVGINGEKDLFEGMIATKAKKGRGRR